MQTFAQFRLQAINEDETLPPEVHRLFSDSLNYYHGIYRKAYPKQALEKAYAGAYARVAAKHGEDVADALKAFHDEHGENN